MFLAPYAALSTFWVRADRYMVDYQPALVLVTVLMAGATAGVLRSGPGRRQWVGAFALLTLCAAAFNGFAGIEQFDAFKDIRAPTYKALERIGNVPSYALGRLGLLRSGPVEIRVVFPGDVTTARTEPLLTLGTPDRSDSLYVVLHPGNQIEFMAHHSRYGGPRSAVMPIIPGRAYTLGIDMGALYPPINHPFFGAMTAEQVRLTKTAVQVRMGGRIVMDERMNSYDAPPGSLEYGRNDLTMTLFGRTFSGKILSAARLPPPPPPVVRVNDGLWRIRCVFPTQAANRQFPLLSSGITGSGTLITLGVLPGNRIRFGVDEWGLGGPASDVIAVDPDKEHVVEVFVGRLAALNTWPEAWGIPWRRLPGSENVLRIRLDGRLVLDAGLKRGPDPLDSYISVGSNDQGFQTAEPVFGAPIRSDPYSKEEARDAVRRNLGSEINDYPGLWRIRCVLPMQRINASFPLLSAGKSGSGTLVYVTVLPDSRVRIGVDDWGIGGASSGILKVPDRLEHVVEVFVGPLAKRGKGLGTVPRAAQGRLGVWLDGDLVLETAIAGNLGPDGSSLGVGVNPQGFSTAEPEFPGRILSDPYSRDGAVEFLARALSKTP
jgi:hypothetical protein